MRVAVIGARRVRQGTGPFLASFCRDAGAEVPAVFATSPTTAAEAADALAPHLGRRPRPCATPEEVFDVPDLDALVIAGPARTHGPWLHAALERGVHALCEKPLLWDGSDPDVEAEQLGRAFLEAGLVLRVNTQWPYTLEVYRELHPDVALPPERFEMRLSPGSAGPEMFLESLPHALSLLTSVLPDPEAEVVDPRARLEGERGRMSFGYRSGDHLIDCRVELVCMPAPPRLAAYGFDGRVATRHVAALEPYTLELEGEGRRVPMPDPTPLLVRSFLDEVASGRPRGLDPGVLPGMRHLVRLMASVPGPTPAPPQDATRT